MILFIINDIFAENKNCNAFCIDKKIFMYELSFIQLISFHEFAKKRTVYSITLLQVATNSLLS